MEKNINQMSNDKQSKSNPFNQNILWLIVKWCFILGTASVAIIGVYKLLK